MTEGIAMLLGGVMKGPRDNTRDPRFKAQQEAEKKAKEQRKENGGD